MPCRCTAAASLLRSASDQRFEVAPLAAELAGSWFAARALKLTAKQLTVEYRALLRDENETVPTPLSEKVDLFRARPPPPSFGAQPRGLSGGVAQMLHADGWWVVVVKVLRRRGEPLLDGTPAHAWETGSVRRK